MAVSTSKRLFNVDEYYRMADIGVLDEDSNVELLEGVIWNMHPPVEHQFTLDEYYRMIAGGILSEGDRVELIEGDTTQEAPVVSSRHAGCVTCLSTLFHWHKNGDAIVSVHNPLRLNHYTEPEPDITLLRARDDFYASEHPGPADALLVVEVTDAVQAYDRDLKLPLYAQAGISEVWLVDLKNEVVAVYTEPEKGSYKIVRQARRGESMTMQSVPGLTIGVGDILGK